MDFTFLESFGLTKNEVKIYTTLLKRGSSLAGELTQRTGIHRRNVYDSLERLIEKGLVSYVNVDNKRVFNPANPERLNEIIIEQKEELKRRQDKLADIIPDLLVLRKEMSRQEVRVFRGIEGIKTVFEDILRTKKDYLAYGQGMWVEDKLKFYIPSFMKRRIKNNIRMRFIYDEGSRNRGYTDNPLTTVRFLPDEYLINFSRRIYGDKLAIILFSIDESLAIIIQNKEIAEGARRHFEVLWKTAQK
ncbi:MAG: hypothetical protein KKF44_03860 [Nanoarchaeota archaeon]|nr:hypothetical protein [Nanoarchaeota archaeon]